MKTFSKIKIAAISLVLLAFNANVQAVTFDLAKDFFSANKVGSPWMLGYYDAKGIFIRFEQFDGNNRWLGGNADIWLHTGSKADFGIVPGHISLHADTGTPVARFVVPYTAIFNIKVDIGGPTDLMIKGSGNKNTNLAGLKVNGVLKPQTSFNNNKKIWILNNMQLNQGQVIDAYVGQDYISGNTDTMFKVTSPDPIPIPAPINGRFL